MGSGPNIRESERPEAAPTGTTLSGPLRAFLLTRLLGRPLSGTTGGADTSAGGRSKLLGQYSGDHDNTRWECRQRFDSLGRRSAGMHEPDSFSQIRPSLALSRSSPGGYRNGLRSHLEEHTAGASSPSLRSVPASTPPEWRRATHCGRYTGFVTRPTVTAFLSAFGWTWTRRVCGRIHQRLSPTRAPRRHVP